MGAARCPHRSSWTRRRWGRGAEGGHGQGTRWHGRTVAGAQAARYRCVIHIVFIHVIITNHRAAHVHCALTPDFMLSIPFFQTRLSKVSGMPYAPAALHKAS